MAQGFQDLSGQIIHRVIGMVKDVESNLVDLVKRSGQIEKLVGIVSAEQKHGKYDSSKSMKAEGPQVRKHDNVISNQDEVDDLLSSLGF